MTTQSIEQLETTFAFSFHLSQLTGMSEEGEEEEEEEEKREAITKRGT